MLFRKKNREIKYEKPKIKVSIYGDSISTYEGYSNTIDTDNAVFYPIKGMCKDLNDTWWMRMIIDNNFELVVNNSSSGCYVKGKGNCTGSNFDEGVGKRINHLSKEDIIPELIFVYMGINDLNSLKTSDQFKEDYDEMLSKLTTLYPTSKLVTLNLQKTTNDDKSELREEYNNYIEELSTKYNTVLVELSKMKISGKEYVNYSSDNLHPNVLGMSCIAGTITKTLKDKKII